VKRLSLTSYPTLLAPPHILLFHKAQISLNFDGEEDSSGIYREHILFRAYPEIPFFKSLFSKGGFVDFLVPFSRRVRGGRFSLSPWYVPYGSYLVEEGYRERAKRFTLPLRERIKS
jgi:hypothetical protein